MENLRRNPGSMRAAINAMCWDCVYDSQAPGNWRQQVTACPLSSCALWQIRPRSRSRLASDASGTPAAA
jgi:hypothetical protein